jgi:type IV pilus assembly protein PilM
VSNSEQNSIWKKEISFSRKRPNVEPVADETPALPPPPAPRRPPAPPSRPRETPAQALGLDEVHRPAPRISPFVREPARSSTDLPTSPPPVERGAADQPPQRPHLVPGETAPTELPVPPRQPEPGHEDTRPPLPPAAAAPAPVVIHPPVPASELPPEPAPAKTPFWKKDLSVRGSKKKNKQEPAVAVAAVAAVAAAPAPPKPDRKAKRAAKAEQAESKPKQKKSAQPGARKKAGDPRAVRTPVWKREVSLKRTERKRTNEETTKQAKRLVGLKIGASQLAAARVVNNNGTPEVAQIARMEIRPGIVVGGELRDPDALAEALKEFFDKNKLPKRGIRLGIANNRIGVRTFDVQGIHDPKQLDNAVRFRAQEALPIPIDEAVLDYHVLSEGVDETGAPFKRILLVVAYRELVDRYVQACRKAGIRLAGIDLEAFALLRALSAPSSESDAAVVAVSVGHQRSTFAVSDGRMCQFTRVLDWGGGSLDIAIARLLDITAAQAGVLKRGLSLLPGAAHPSELSPEQTAIALDAVRSSLQAFARELVSSLQFYQNQPESLGIGEIVLTGGSAHLPGIADELQRLTGVLVRVGDPLARVKVGKRVDEGDQIGSFAVAIGLGIED